MPFVLVTRKIRVKFETVDHKVLHIKGKLRLKFVLLCMAMTDCTLQLSFITRVLRIINRNRRNHLHLFCVCLFLFQLSNCAPADSG